MDAARPFVFPMDENAHSYQTTDAAPAAEVGGLSKDALRLMGLNQE